MGKLSDVCLCCVRGRKKNAPPPPLKKQDVIPQELREAVDVRKGKHEAVRMTADSDKTFTTIDPQKVTPVQIEAMLSELLQSAEADARMGFHHYPPPPADFEIKEVESPKIEKVAPPKPQKKTVAFPSSPQEQLGDAQRPANTAPQTPGRAITTQQARQLVGQTTASAEDKPTFEVASTSPEDSSALRTPAIKTPAEPPLSPAPASALPSSRAVIQSPSDLNSTQPPSPAPPTEPTSPAALAAAVPVTESSSAPPVATATSAPTVSAAALAEVPSTARPLTVTPVPDTAGASVISSPAPAVPVAASAVPVAAPAVPEAAPAVPEAAPAVSVAAPTSPAPTSVVPLAAPAAPPVEAAPAVSAVAPVAPVETAQSASVDQPIQASVVAQPTQPIPAAELVPESQAAQGDPVGQPAVQAQPALGEQAVQAVQPVLAAQEAEPEQAAEPETSIAEVGQEQTRLDSLQAAIEAYADRQIEEQLMLGLMRMSATAKAPPPAEFFDILGMKLDELCRQDDTYGKMLALVSTAGGDGDQLPPAAKEQLRSWAQKIAQTGIEATARQLSLG